jgi:RTX calcium-binding nonapeptide repeat (4 copies)
VPHRANCATSRQASPRRSPLRPLASTAAQPQRRADEPRTRRAHALRSASRDAAALLLGGGGAAALLDTGNSNGDAECVGDRHQIARGGGGNDLIGGSAGEDYLHGGDGNDWLFGYGASDVVVGGGGSDHLYGATGDDCLYGHTYSFDPDPLPSDNNGSNASDWHNGGDGVDTMCDQGSTADTFNGQSGPSYHYLASSNDTVVGSSYSFSYACTMSCLLVSW